MTREEAHTLLEVMAIELTGELADIECPVTERTKLLGKQLEAIDMAIEALQEVQRHEETFEWCHGCNEYDKDNHCCHRWSKVIRNTVEELKTDRPTDEWCTDCRQSDSDADREVRRSNEAGLDQEQRSLGAVSGVENIRRGERHMMRICAAILVGWAGLLLLATIATVTRDLWKEYEIRNGLRPPTKEEWRRR